MTKSKTGTQVDPVRCPHHAHSAPAPEPLIWASPLLACVLGLLSPHPHLPPAALAVPRGAGGQFTSFVTLGRGTQPRRASDHQSPGRVLGPGQAPALPLPPREAQAKGRRDASARSGLGEGLGKKGGPSAQSRAWLMALEHQGPAPASKESWDEFLTNMTKGPEASPGDTGGRC